ncbi:hypothetical protein [Dyadobacter fermentans]|uniref:hypothetical protein n=1 Tax=Dyadobacter fermentans TaxID=94254 RepID=UPI001CBFC64A|nr:hypothetical protein [Dyadobacter fermentans]MBZ1362170.1 hypothetical protein [Dyadobacter fermentans]
MDQNQLRGILLPNFTEAEKLEIDSPKIGEMIWQTDGIQGVHVYSQDGWIILYGLHPYQFVTTEYIDANYPGSALEK